MRKDRNRHSVISSIGNPAFHQAGFTLFEILLVIFLISGIAGVVITGGSRMFSSIQFALEKSDIEKSLNDLPFQSFATKKTIILGVLPENEPETGEGQQDLNQEMQVDSPHLKLPDGWKAYVDEPIIYRGDGYCGGGSIRVKSETRDLSYSLRAPNCAPQLEDKS